MESKMVLEIEDDYLAIKDTLENNSYYTKKYLRDNEGGDRLVKIYSNKICVLSLSPYHPILKNNLDVESVSFQANKKTNRLDNQVSGKKKLGAQFLDINSIICSIHCKGLSSPYIIRSGITGKLIEVNSKILENLNLLKSYENSYIAVILPRKNNLDREMKQWLSPQDYSKVVGET